MTDYSASLENLSAAHQRVYEALYRAAYLGERCPTNVELARVGGISTYPRWATDAVAILEREGLISVTRGRVTRIVILPSGQSTSGEIHDERTYRHTEEHRHPVPSERPIAITACTYCGVRSDIGCKHSRAAA